jgi:hypothetical protein
MDITQKIYSKIKSLNTMLWVILVVAFFTLLFSLGGKCPNPCPAVQPPTTPPVEPYEKTSCQKTEIALSNPTSLSPDKPGGCTPSCPTNTCGSDGCGGTCSCSAGYSCVNGVCNQPTTLSCTLFSNCGTGQTCETGSCRNLNCDRGVSPTFLIAANTALCWLKKQQFLDSTRPLTHGLVNSFEDTPKIAYLYDQAVAIIAFSYAYKKINDANDATAIDYRLRALLILTAIKNLSSQEVDNDINLAKSNWGTLSQPVYILCNAYNLQYTNTPACIVNNGNTCGTGNVTLVNEGAKHVGPQLWLVMAIAHYSDKTGDTQFNYMINPIINYCASFQASDGGLNGGLSFNLSTSGAKIPETWASTEHNLDAYAVLRRYRSNTALLTGVSDFLTKAPVNGGVFNGLDATDTGNLKTGPRFHTGRFNSDPMLDTQPWGVLAYPNHPSGKNGMAWAEDRNYTKLSTLQGVLIAEGYDFDSEKTTSGEVNDDIWWEGTSFMAVAYKALGNTTKSDQIKNWIMEYGQNANGGVKYSVNGTNNTYWEMSKLPGVASTGWAYFAWMNFNPFALSSGDPLYF